MKKRTFLWIAALALFYPRVASADANLCNKTGRDIWATFGEQFSLTDPSNDYVVGWYHIRSGQCAKPVVGDVCNWWANVWGNCSNDVLYYADDAAGTQWGPTSKYTTSICTTNSGFYETPQYSYEHQPCAGGRVWRLWAVWFYGQNSDITITFLK